MPGLAIITSAAVVFFKEPVGPFFCGSLSSTDLFLIAACCCHRCCIWGTFILVQRTVSRHLSPFYTGILILKTAYDSLNKSRSDIRRLTATASSPLYSLYNETIDGIVMIRAFGQDKLMMATMKVLNNRERTTCLADWTGKFELLRFFYFFKS